MAKLKISVHPLFIIFGIYFVLTGKVFSFAVFTLVAVIHELGHSIVAEKLGYRLKKITLMPYGAVVSGEQDLFSYSDEIVVALAGPITNIVTALTFVAAWWFAPEIYPYTDLAVFASVSIATINLLPCFPLDGGRILLAFLSRKIERKKALKIVKALGYALSACLFGLFVYSVFVGVNFSLLFFSLFVAFGNFSAGKESVYVRIFSGVNINAVEKGREIRKVAVTTATPVKALYKFVGANDLAEVSVFNEEMKLTARLPCEKTCRLLQLAKPYLTVSEEIKRLGFDR